MSDTTGWTKGREGYLFKKIGGHIWGCQKNYRTGLFEISHQGRYPFATRPTLRECQRLAHDTARLWAGGGE